jgi:hypothetical protein
MPDESKRQLNLLGKLVSPSQRDGLPAVWLTQGGGYYMQIRKFDNSSYTWAVGLVGNTGSFNETGQRSSLDLCVAQAHQAIAVHIQGVEAVKTYVLNYVDQAQPKSRYERDPVI